MELVLKRTYHPKGTNGELFFGKDKICSTIELPWKENKRQVSCIPEGRYALTKRCTPKFGKHLLVRKVPGRSYILIHAFNIAIAESRGCIGPVSECTGEGIGIFSRAALKNLTDLVYTALKFGKPVFLTIQSEQP